MKMNHAMRSVVLLTLSLFPSAQAAIGDLDLAKFVSVGTQELEKIYGAQNLEPGVEIYFQDGVGVGSSKISDFATLTLLKKPKFTPESSAIHRVGYRLEMNGTIQIMNVNMSTCVAPICQDPKLDSLALGFAFVGSAVVSLNKAPITVKEMKQIEARIMKAYPSAKITLFEFIFMLQVDAHPLDMPGIIALVSKEKKFSGFDLNFETYAYPIEFDPAIEIKQRSGTVDMDKFRGVSKYYKDQGVPFTTETTIPKILQP